MLIYVSLFQESLKTNLFSSTDIHMLRFIADPILSPVKNSTNIAFQAENVSNTYEAVVTLIIYRNVFQKHWGPNVTKV